MISEMMEDRVHETARTLHTNMSHLKHVDVLQLLNFNTFLHIFSNFLHSTTIVMSAVFLVLLISV